MLRIILVLLGSIITSINFAQKPMLDTGMLGNWPALQMLGISNDGEYFAYFLDVPGRKNTLIVQSLQSEWKEELEGVSNGIFSSTGQFVYQEEDTLTLIKLGSCQIKRIKGVTNYKVPRSESVEWLAYKLKDTNEVVLINLRNGEEYQYLAVDDFIFDHNGRTLLLKSSFINDSDTLIDLNWMDLRNGSVTKIYHGQNCNVNSITFDAVGSQVVFNVQENVNNQELISIWYYKKGMPSARMEVMNCTPGIGQELRIKNVAADFSPDGTYIFFKLQEPQNNDKTVKFTTKVDIWSYKDHLIQSMQQSIGDNGNEFAAVIKTGNKQVVRLENKNEKLETSSFEIRNAGYVVVGSNAIYNDNPFIKDTVTYYLVSLKTGARKIIESDLKFSCVNFSYSPDAKHIVYYNRRSHGYFSYEIISGRKKNISKDVTVSLAFDDSEEYCELGASPVGIAGWLTDSDDLIVYDDYDIWKLNARGKYAPENITSGFGRAHTTKFRILDGNESNSDITPTRPILLTAFNSATKDNGFYSMSNVQCQIPQLLAMQPAVFYENRSFPGDVGGSKPQKALNALVWILKRQSALEAPNLYLTRDFIDFTALTNIQPQKSFNWLTAELLTWKQFNGRMNQGILYKPENFDPKKKYPVIVTFYEKKSHELNNFKYPTFSYSFINIPFFVSNEYLIFTPDIQFAVGETGKSVYNAVVSGAQYLSKMPWVNEKKIAITGHSFGGFQTNYLITHTDMFVAAVEGAGVSNLISSYGSLRGGGDVGSNNQEYYETGQGRMRYNLWQELDRYVSNSPILKADKIATPLLIMHNKKDMNVSWSQGVELFMGLRRLGKLAWMLQYDDSGHVLLGGDSKDFTVRIKQFFDHYLKDRPAPIWMTKGIPATQKQIITGYDFEPAGQCGKECKVCKKWNEQYKKYPEMFNKPIQEWHLE